MVGLGMAVGVDLGTTASSIAVFHNGGTVVVPDDGCSRIPSVVAVHCPAGESSPETLIGAAALRRRPGRARCVIRNVKRVAGCSYVAVRGQFVGTARVLKNDDGPDSPVIKTDSVAFRPEEVSAMLLRKLSALVEGHPIYGQLQWERTVISVPAYFDAVQRQTVKNAGKIAGLKGVLGLINETSAAALEYASRLEESAGWRTALVMDLGAGGSSLSVVEASSQGVRVLATLPRRLPGGLDMDELVVQSLHKTVEQQLGRPCTLNCRDEEALYAAWELAKPRLVGAALTMVAVDAFLPVLGYNLKTLVSEQDFKGFCSLLMISLITAFRELFQMAKVNMSEVQDVVVVGGCSRIPVVRRLVQQQLRGANVVPLDSDLSIATGTALFAGSRLSLEDVSPLGFHYELDSLDLPYPLLSPNERIPCTKEFFVNNYRKRTIKTMQRCGDESVTVATHRIEASPDQEQVRVEVRVGSDGIPEWHAPGDLSFSGGLCCCMKEEELLNLSTPSSLNHNEAESERKNLEAFCCGVISGEFLTVDSPMMKLAMKEFGEAVDWLHANPGLPAALYVEKRHTLQTLLETALDDQSAPDWTRNGPVDNAQVVAVRFQTTVNHADDSDWDGNWDSYGGEAPPTNRRNGGGPKTKTSILAAVHPDDMEAMKFLLQVLHRRVLAQEGSRIDLSGHPELNPAFAKAFHTHVALESLAEAVLWNTMEEVRAAGKVCLLVDTIVVPHGEMVSFILRYVQPATGHILERLVAIISEARSVSGQTLMQRFTSLCERHRVDWKRCLCGVSTDSSRITQEAFCELVFLLQQESTQELYFVYNGSYSLPDIISQTGECQLSTSDFFDAICALRDFFGVWRRGQALARNCGVRMSDITLSSSVEAIAFVADHYRAVTVTLASLKVSDPGTAFIARRLSTAMKGPFVNILLLFDEIFRILKRASDSVSYSGSPELTYDDLEGVFKHFEMKKGIVSDVVDKLSQLFPGKQLTDAEVTLLEDIASSSLATIRRHLCNCMCVVRDIEMLYKLLELSDALSNPTALFNWLTDVSNPDVLSELKRAEAEYVKAYAKSQFAHPAECLNRLRQLHDRDEYRRRHPALLRCLEEVLTLPLVPAKGGLRKLHQLRRHVAPSCGESELVIQCAVDADGPGPLESVFEMAIEIIVNKS